MVVKNDPADMLINIIKIAAIAIIGFIIIRAVLSVV